MKKKTATQKLTPSVQAMLDKAEAMEREASLLRRLAKAESHLAYFRGRVAKWAKGNRSSSRPLAS